MALFLTLTMGEFIRFFRWFPDIERYQAGKELDDVLGRAVAARNPDICDELPITRKSLTTDGVIDSTGATGTRHDCMQQYNNQL